jgi:hypothetical protein
MLKLTSVGVPLLPEPDAVVDALWRIRTVAACATDPTPRQAATIAAANDHARDDGARSRLARHASRSVAIVAELGVAIDPMGRDFFMVRTVVCLKR